MRVRRVGDRLGEHRGDVLGRGRIGRLDERDGRQHRDVDLDHLDDDVEHHDDGRRRNGR
jgi:hypothetical protein